METKQSNVPDELPLEDTRRERALSAMSRAKRCLGVAGEPAAQLKATGELAEARYVLTKVRESIVSLETAEELLSDLVADKEIR